jgi:hypothetical protein
MTSVIGTQAESVDAAVDLIGRRCVSVSAPNEMAGQPRRIGIIESVQPSGSVLARFDGAPVEIPAAAFVALPRVGERVDLSQAVGGPLRGFWLGARVSSPYGHVVTVHVLDGSTVVERAVRPDEVHAPRVVTGTVETAVAVVCDALAEQIAQAERVRVEHEMWRQSLSEAACARADDQGWCRQFDEFMADWGLQGRDRNYSIEVLVTSRCTVSVSAQSADAAEQLVDTGMVRDALDWDCIEWTVDETTED